MQPADAGQKVRPLPRPCPKPPRYPIRRQKKCRAVQIISSQSYKEPIIPQSCCWDIEFLLETPIFLPGTIQNRQREKKNQYWKCQRFFWLVSNGNLSVLLQIKRPGFPCVQTRDKHYFSTCFPPALTSGCIHYASLKIFFL